jgi:hypothetical protein
MHSFGPATEKDLSQKKVPGSVQKAHNQIVWDIIIGSITSANG